MASTTCYRGKFGAKLQEIKRNRVFIKNSSRRRKVERYKRIF